jgi:hypothetical protein
MCARARIGARLRRDAHPIHRQLSRLAKAEGRTLHAARCMFCTLHVALCTEFARQIRRGGGKGKGRGGGKNSPVGEEARIKKHPTFKGYAQSVGSTCEQLLRCGAGARRWL